MTRQEVLKQLLLMVGGSEWLESVMELDREMGLKASQLYLKYAEDGMKNNSSDGAYWGWRSDEALALTVGCIFKYEGEEYPELPGFEGRVLMDKQSLLLDWGTQLLSDHVHVWEGCQHEAPGKRGSHDSCKQIEEFRMWHYVCNVCGRGKEEYPDIS